MTAQSVNLMKHFTSAISVLGQADSRKAFFQILDSHGNIFGKPCFEGPYFQETLNRDFVLVFVLFPQPYP